MFAIDDAMGEVVAKATEPALAAIKLAWWRERLEELDEGKVPAEPRLQAVVDELRTRGVTGTKLAELEDGWLALLEEQPNVERIAVRGDKLFDIAAGLIGGSGPMLEVAGRLYALQGINRRGITEIPVTDALRQLTGYRFGRRLRPLTMLAALAARDAARSPPEPEATPGRALTLLRHRFTGRIA